MHQKMTDIPLGLLGHSVSRGRYPFGFQAPEHALHRRVVPAISPATHALTHAIAPEPLTKQATHDKAAAAKTPAERQAAMQEGMKTMKDSLAMMNKQQGAAGCMGPGMGMSGSKDGMGMGKGMMDMMMKMMDQQSSMTDMPMSK
jgi:hypothetical protein